MRSMASAIRDNATLVALLVEGWTPPLDNMSPHRLDRLVDNIEYLVGRLTALNEIRRRG